MRPSRARLSTPRIKRPNANALRTAESQSNDLPEPTVRGSAGMAMAMASTPIGTLTANSHSHEAWARMAEATVGPIAAEIEMTTAFRPMPRPSRR